MSRALGLDIEIRLRQMGPEEIPYTVFRKILDSLNRSAFESEKKELKEIRKQFPEFPSVAFDAANYRMNDHRSSAIIIKELKPGSLIVAVSVAGIAIWVLQQTLGETLKESWKQSKSHEKLKAFLLKRMGEKRHTLATDIAKRIEAAVTSETSIGYNGPGDANYLDEPSKITIDVRIEISHKDYPPDRRETLR